MSKYDELENRIYNLECAFKYPAATDKNGLGALYSRATYVHDLVLDTQETLNLLLDYLDLQTEKGRRIVRKRVSKK